VTLNLIVKPWSSSNEPLFDLLLHCVKVVLNTRSFTDLKRIVTVGQDNWREISLAVEGYQVSIDGVEYTDMALQPANDMKHRLNISTVLSSLQMT